MNNQGKPLMKWVVLVLTTLTALCFFAVLDIVLSGIISLFVLIWSRDVAIAVFKWVTVSLFSVELLFTIPIVKRCLKEGEDK